MSGEDAVPELSVIVVSFSGAAMLERCLAALERQTLQEGVETVVVRRGDTAGADEYGRLRLRFPKVCWLHAPESGNVPQMRRWGITHSRGEIIALLEDDCVAPEGWCATLLAAHRGPCAAIGGAVAPGDYAKGLDWAVYFCEYGRFMPPLSAAAARALPGTNVSYKRSALADLFGRNGYDSDGMAIEGFYEVFVHRALQQAGRSLKVEPALVVYNGNCWRLRDALVSRFHHGRGFAGMRVAGRPPWERLPLLGLAVCLPVIQVVRIVLQAIAGKRYVLRLGPALPWITMCAISWSLGEFVGYLCGPGDSPRHWH